ncbi:hypothetical protein GAYE_SCF47G5887 [Galdieria yellowstonensis]|uniref:CBF1-interacting co-repressor CIR N-terminal domain-containing protein n=1 Tax=Galdieria yellowstonensis TaxID=3028027 RepID=A0AAV9IKZ4_9RHOD|nr:hypothetical protein GAYE_SCF47G5887 [Galdieria yellowstonensis]
MNLLPHKSWNIWSTKNIARIERDEQAFEKEQREAQRQEIQRQRDERLEKLRNKVHARQEERKQGDEQRCLSGEKNEEPARSVNTTIKTSLKESLKVPWYSVLDKVEETKPQPSETREEDPIVKIREWEKQQKVIHKERKRKREEKKKQAPSFIRLDENGKWNPQVWEQLRTQQRQQRRSCKEGK